MKILIVDRHAYIAEMLRQMLSSRGYATVVVEEALSGLAAIHQHRPDLIFLDNRVPGLPVGQFIRAARTVLPDVEIVLVSGAPNIAEIAHGLSVRFLPKPFDPAQVLWALPEVVRSAQSSAAMKKVSSVAAMS